MATMRILRKVHYQRNPKKPNSNFHSTKGKSLVTNTQILFFVLILLPFAVYSIFSLYHLNEVHKFHKIVWQFTQNQVEFNSNNNTLDNVKQKGNTTALPTETNAVPSEVPIEPTDDPVIEPTNKPTPNELSLEPYEVSLNLQKILQKKGVTCYWPKLDPFDSSIKKYYSRKPNNWKCTARVPLLFYTDLKSNLIYNDTRNNIYIPQCCYKQFFRINGSDSAQPLYSKKCHPITRVVTKIPPTMDYITVFCRNATAGKMQEVDVFGFIHEKPKLEDKLNKIVERGNLKVDEQVNVVIFAMDGLSHLNMIRKMPKSRNYLLNNLSGLSMDGYAKVGDNSLPNVMAAFAGQSLDEANDSCIGESLYFDTCPIIWKNFSAAGYATLYAEDKTALGTFNYLKKGFRFPPTDYYWRPMMKTLNDILWSGEHTCYGPRLSFEILLDFMVKAAFQFGNDKRYFQLVWTNALSHDALNDAELGDESLFLSLKWMNTNNYLNNMVLIFMSDHGFRYGHFRDTYQGKIEEHTPFLYMMFPKWFKEKYRTAVSNFELNRNRLTTPYDLHETLLDLVTLGNIETDKLKKRYADLMHSVDQLGKIPRGISLFLPVPLQRNCTTAQIPDEYCVCHEMKSVSLKGNIEVENVSKAVVDFINNLMKDSPQCSKLELKITLGALKSTPLNAEIQDRMKNNGPVKYVVGVMTEPGDGQFYATVTRKTTDGKWIVSKTIKRINRYRNQSHCETVKNLKKFCYC